jgi:APA family basic amino acid/polyamine antiporter
LATDAARPTLLRALGPATAIALVVGGVIGSGVFAKPGNIAQQGLGFEWIISAWVTGGVLCLLGALCFAELGAMLPRAGGPYVYLREAYGPAPAFLYGWGEVLFNRPGGIGALGAFFVVSLLKMLGWQAGIWTQIGLIVGLIALLGWVNVLGVVWGGRVQNVTTWIKAGGVALLAASPFVLQAVSGAAMDPANYRTTLTAPSQERPWLLSFGAIMLAVMWAYHGWSGFTPVAEEIREPQRNIPLALLGGMGIVMLLYCSANIAYHGVLSLNELATAGDKGAHAMADRLIGPSGTVLITAIIMCSTFGAMNSNLLLSPRVAFAMGRDGTFFRGLGEVHVVYRTPAIAIVVQSLMAIALVVASGLVTIWVRDAAVERILAATAGESAVVRKKVALAIEGKDRRLTEEIQEALQNEPAETQSRVLAAIRGQQPRGPWLAREVVGRLENKSVFDLLTNFVVFASGLFEALCVLGVIVLRCRRPNLARPYRTWGYPLVPIAYLLCFGAFLAVVFVAEPFEAMAGLVLVAAGLPVFLLTRLGGKNKDQDRPQGIEGDRSGER